MRKEIILRIIKDPLLLPFVMVKRFVDGLISFDLGLLLYDTVLQSKHESRNIVEVGAYKGLSTCYLSHAAKRTKRIVRTFELFTGLPSADPILDDSFASGLYSSSKEEFELNVMEWGRAKSVDLTAGDARDSLLPVLAGGGFSVAFLDADVYAVTKEILLQLISVSVGGEVIILHDAECLGISKAIEEVKHLITKRVDIITGTQIVAVLSL